MNVDEQKSTHVGEGRGSPLVLKEEFLTVSRIAFF